MGAPRLTRWHPLTEALCAAIDALLDDAEIALEGDHYEGALERITQAETVLQIARATDGYGMDARLYALTQRIEEIATLGAELADEEETDG